MSAEASILHAIRDWWGKEDGSDAEKLHKLLAGKTQILGHTFELSSGDTHAAIIASKGEDRIPIISAPSHILDTYDRVKLNEFFIGELNPHMGAPKSPTRRKNIKTPKTGGKGKTQRKRKNTKSKKNHKK